MVLIFSFNNTLVHRRTLLAENKEGGNKKGKEPEKEGLDRIMDFLEKSKDDKNRYQ